MTAKQLHVIVSGAGPVGAVTAIALSQRGLRVTLLEASHRIDDSPRASTLHPSTLEYLAQVGILDEVIRQGLVARYFQFWDRDSRTRVAQFDHELLRDDTPYPFVVQTEQHKIVRIGLDKLAQYPDATFRSGVRVLEASQDGEGVAVVTENADTGERETLSCDYLVACDGGRSALRKHLGVSFDGHTFPERFTVLTTLHDFERSLGCSYRNYLAGSQEWANLFKVSGDDMKGRWRAVFPTRENETDEEALSDAAVMARLSGVDPSCRLEDVVHRNIYNVHQRVAGKFRVGRIFLAGDSSHLNNPIGGLGLNCGVHDALELAATLEMAREGASEHDLDRYDRRRRTLNVQFVQEQTINNKKRLEEKDPAARAARLDELRAIEADPVRQRQFLLRSSLLASVAQARTIA
ncbi:MAG: FAD-dependent monooxygenase [Burkholderiaceae bacterium]|nr:FAD-dependent monooxygenase [Burkholderiaceae bacterium]